MISRVKSDVADLYPVSIEAAAVLANPQHSCPQREGLVTTILELATSSEFAVFDSTPIAGGSK